jgi:hypothetical protein
MRWKGYSSTSSAQLQSWPPCGGTELQFDYPCCKIFFFLTFTRARYFALQAQSKFKARLFAAGDCSAASFRSRTQQVKERCLRSEHHKNRRYIIRKISRNQT